MELIISMNLDFPNWNNEFKKCQIDLNEIETKKNRDITINKLKEKHNQINSLKEDIKKLKNN